MKKKHLLTLILSSLGPWSLGIPSALAQSPTGTRNHVVETVVRVPNKKTTASLSGLPVDSASRTISYMDGLGRPLQVVQWQASPTKKDIVQHMVYDGLGREARKYLPYAEQTSADGSFKTDPLGSQSAFYGTSGWDASVAKTPYPYSQSVLEASPMGRVLEQGAPGATWQPYSASVAGSGHTVRPGYGLNAAGEVPLWTASGSGASTSGSYAAGRLYKSISRDENWTTGKIGTTESFTDMGGRVVMKRVWETESISLSTHYIYDRYGNLAYVVPPAVTATSFTESVSDASFTGFIYAYHYDGRKRLIEKKVPGRGWEHMVYNKLDQLRYQQDAVQRAANTWSWTKYDALGRVVMTGLQHDINETREYIQGLFDGFVGNDWEARDNARAEGYTKVTFPLAYPVENLSIKILSINYYDDYDFYDNTFGQPNGTTEVGPARTSGLPTATRVTTLGTGDMLLTVTYYDADGRVVTTRSQNHLGGTDVTGNSYNFAGELTASTRTHVANSVTTSIANAYLYDHMGRKVSTREDINSQGWVSLNKLEYNEIGQLKKKNLHSTDGSTFLQNTTFGYNERGWMKASNSSEFRMQLDYQDGTYPQYNGNISNQRWGSSLGNVYTYQYDRLNRLVNGTSTGVSMSEALTYDVMGNITSMNRDNTGVMGYTYKNGNNSNQLDSISWLTTTSYAYDANGNATTDGRNGMALTYNYLNLPVTVSKTGVSLTYTYDASGQKLRKVSNLSGTTDYVDGIQYTGGAIDFIQTEEGRAVNQGGTYVYEYNLTDHLGNVRYTFNRHPTTGAVQPLQQDDYYAFGKRFGSGGTNRYLYNGKELQDELGQYDYGARFYDPEIGRWNSVDPLAEKMRRFSPYNYAFNNPIRFVDPDGMVPTDFVDEKGNVSTIEDGSSARFKVSGTGVGKYYEFAGFGGNDDSKYVINLKSIIQESQNLNMSNSSLAPNELTYCNFGTQNIMRSVDSAIEGQREFFSLKTNTDVLITGKANEMAPKLGASGAYMSADKETALNTAKNGGLAIASWINPKPERSGHVATLSVGDNIKKGELSNIGTNNGFMPIKSAFGDRDVKYFILNPAVVQSVNEKYQKKEITY